MSICDCVIDDDDEVGFNKIDPPPPTKKTILVERA